MIALILQFAQFIDSPERMGLPPKNVVEICIDDGGYTDIASIPSPNIDELRSISIDFPRSYVTSPMCSPSRVGSLTGNYSSLYGIGKILNPLANIALPPGEGTKAKVFRDAGYATLHVGKWHMNPKDPMAPGTVGGFDTWRATILHNPGVLLLDGTGNGDYSNWNRVDDGVETTVHGKYITTEQTDAFVDWWSTTPGPKYGQLWLTAPHAPFHIPPSSLLPAGYPIPTTDREKYEAALVAADTAIGVVLAAIDMENTFVVFWSDNGTPKDVPLPGQDPNKLKMSPYEGGVNVPFYVHIPGQTQALRSRQLISSADFLATYADIVGQYAPNTNGISFARALGILSAPETTRDHVYAVRYAPNGFGPFNSREQLVRDTDGFKLIRFEKAGLPTQDLLFKLPDEINEVVNPAKYAELAAIMDGI